MTTYEQEIEISNKLKEHYECDVIINESIPYTLYRASDLGKILGMSNIRAILANYNKLKISRSTNGGNQIVVYITCESLIKLLTKCRKPNAIEVSKKINIDVITKYYVSIETDIIKCILTTFDGNIITPQYRVDNYYIDLYFDEYSLAIECDERHHTYPNNKIQDLERQLYITKKLGCRFIRFNPSDPKFNLFQLLNNIHIHLSVCPRKELENYS
jgi:very-short-patch-repair endonuclease